MRPTSTATTPTEEIAAFAIDAACRAPSVHNTRPWRFTARGSRVTLHADPDRRLGVADPDGREMLISCGAALFTLRLAARHLGRTLDVRQWPDPDRPMLLADVEIAGPRPATPAEHRLFDQVERRHTHRGGFGPRRPATGLLSKLAIEAEHEGAELRIVADPRTRKALAGLSETAEQTQRLDPDHRAELAHWAPPPGRARPYGVHPDAYPREPGHTDPDFAARDFARGQGWGYADPDDHGDVAADSAGVVAVLTTRGDTAADHLAAGQALQRVLLRAAEEDVSAAFHTQALELPELRDFIRGRYCDGAYPQMLMRLGHAEGGNAPRSTPEKDGDEMTGYAPETGGTAPEVLDEAECLRLLASAEVGRLAYAGRYGPTVLPVNFVLHEGTIVFRTAHDSPTDEDLRTGIDDAEYKVAFEVDELDSAAREGWSVLVQGSVHHVSSEAERASVREAGVEPWAGGDRELFLRIRPTRITGRRLRR
jgi:nitroimidazol reductase NimA-like FMN-containing flavoprotein (pyridoxamine 5'-phosphate oxidase superfamily)